MKKMKLLFTLALPVLLCQNALAQPLSRLVAEAHRSNNGIMFKQVDSVAFSYSGTRGGDLTHQLNFDNSTNWAYSGDTGYINSMYLVQTFDANNNITTVTTESWNDSTWVLQTKLLNTYDSTNQLTSAVLQTWDSSSWVPVSEHTYTYNSGGKVQTDIYQTWNLVAFVPTSEKVYSYDLTNTLLINETDENLIGATVYTEQIAYAYDSATSHLITTTYSSWNGTGWADSSMNTDTYDGYGDLSSVMNQTYNAVTASWNNAGLKTYSSFTAMGSKLPQAELDQYWSPIGSGSWNNTRKFTYTYNDSGQMTSSTGESWNVTGLFEYASGDPMANYYYQAYTTISSVKNIVSTNGTANVYPVPAQGMLHIDLSWTTAQPATIAMYDMNGRMVSPVINVPSATEYRTGISVNNFAPGIYLIKINGAQGQIVKQIVVSH